MVDANAVILLAPTEAQTLAACEHTIEAGLKTFVAVGEALLTIRDQRLYRAEYGTFEDYCGERWGMGGDYARKMIRAAEVVGNLQADTIVSVLPATESQARPLTSLPPEQQREAWQRAVETAPEGKVTAAHVTRVVEEMTDDDDEEPLELDDDAREWMDAPMGPPRPAPMAVHFSSATPEHYTPRHIVERVLRLWDVERITLDPCSPTDDPTTAPVPAESYYTEATDGLVHEWSGLVYMNPPYGDEIEAWVRKLVTEYDALNVEEAVALVPARTDTGWFDLLWQFPICFVRGRLKFGDATNSAPFPSAIVYLGSNPRGFRAAFGAIGRIVVELQETGHGR